MPLPGFLEDIPLLLRERLTALSTSAGVVILQAGVQLSRLSTATPTMCITWPILLTAALDIAQNKNGHNSNEHFNEIGHTSNGHFKNRSSSVTDRLVNLSSESGDSGNSGQSGIVEGMRRQRLIDMSQITYINININTLYSR